jgi:DNA-binding transcriptional LysR family regulator
MNLPLFDLDLLRTLTFAHDQGSFRDAARSVGRTQSAVSLQMRRLEGLAGVDLFEKAGRNVQLTEGGFVLLEYARRLLSLNDEAVQAVTGLKIRGKIRLGMLQDFAETILPSALASFSRAHPGVELEVRVERSTDLLSALQRRSLDLAILFGLKGPGDAFVAQSAGKVPMVWIWKHAPEADEELNLVLFEAPCAFRTAALENLGDRRWRRTFTSPSLSGTWAAVEAGLGVTVRTPLGVSKGLIMNNRLPGLKSLPSIQLYLISRENEKSPIVHLLRDVLFNTLQRSVGFLGGSNGLAERSKSSSPVGRHNPRSTGRKPDFARPTPRPSFRARQSAATAASSGRLPCAST